MEKIIQKLPKEVAEAIEKVWLDHGDLHSKHMTLNNWNYLNDNYHISVKALRPYAENHPIEYMTALVNGYEVEETPEDKVKQLYKTRENEANSKPFGSDDKPYYDGICRGIKECLEALNIKVKGIN